MDKLQWFKFTPSDWMMGKIQRCPEITQARFMRLCCLYWNKECLLSIEDAEIEIDKEHLDILINKKIIKSENEFVKIDFLDEQMDGIIETSEKRRTAVLKRWNKVKQKDTSVLQEDTSVLQSDTDKSRVDKKREDNIENKNLSDAYFTEEKFLIWFNGCRTHLKLQSNIKKLSRIEQQYFSELKNTYTIDEFCTAFLGFSKDEYFVSNSLLFPIHFLKIENFTKFLNYKEVKNQVKLGMNT